MKGWFIRNNIRWQFMYPRKMPKVCKQKLSQTATKEKYFKPINFILIHNNYQFKITKFLGQGAYAQVFEAIVKSIGTSNTSVFIPTIVALKIIKLELVKSQKAKNMLETELQIQKKLNHPNIVKMYYSFRDYEYLYMVLEHCNEGALDKHPLFKTRDARVFTFIKCISFQILNGLMYLHKNHIIHRDLKLGNIFINNTNGITIKIGDFGLCALIEHDSKRKTVCGTPNYIAPEVLFGKDCGHSYEADVWSFGIILYTLLIGNPPFQESTVDEIYTRIRKNEFCFPDRFKEMAGQVSDTLFDAAKELINGILVSHPENRLTLKEIWEHRFFKLIESSKNDTYESSHITTNQSKKISMCSLILYHLEHNLYQYKDISEDHVIFSFPMSELKCIGYIMKSGMVGIIYYNKEHAYLIYNKFIYTRLGSTTKEEYEFGSIPTKYQKTIENLKYFILNFTSLSWNSIVLPLQITNSILKITRMRHGYIFLLANKMLVFDFNFGIRVIISNYGKDNKAIDEDGNVEFTYETKCKIMEVLQEHINK